MGSRSTYLRGAFGGYNGRILQKNDVLRCGTPSPEAERIIRYLRNRLHAPAYAHHGVCAAQWSVLRWHRQHQSSGKPYVLRVTEGVHTHEFTKPSQRLFFATTFHVTQEADRMGIRLAGQMHELPFLAPPMVLQKQRELISSAVLPGTIQVPLQSSPIVLLADAQTVGGYPIIASVCSADISLLAQLRPGDKVQFHPISLAEAHELMVQREEYFLYLRRSLQVLS
jgi:antagonist of KipI